MDKISKGEGRFYIAGDGKDLAEITYRTEENTGNLVIDHTFVSEDLRGQGQEKSLFGRSLTWPVSRVSRLYRCARMRPINSRSTRNTRMYSNRRKNV